jgi:hypothetical protein
MIGIALHAGRPHAETSTTSRPHSCLIRRTDVTGTANAPWSCVRPGATDRPVEPVVQPSDTRLQAWRIKATGRSAASRPPFPSAGRDARAPVARFGGTKPMMWMMRSKINGLRVDPQSLLAKRSHRGHATWDASRARTTCAAALPVGPKRDSVERNRIADRPMQVANRRPIRPGSDHGPGRKMQ